MQENESLLVFLHELKILSFGITVRHHWASLVMPNSYSHDRIFNPHLTIIKDSYNLAQLCWKDRYLHSTKVPFLIRRLKFLNLKTGSVTSLVSYPLYSMCISLHVWRTSFHQNHWMIEHFSLQHLTLSEMVLFLLWCSQGTSSVIFARD